MNFTTSLNRENFYIFQATIFKFMKVGNKSSFSDNITQIMSKKHRDMGCEYQVLSNSIQDQGILM